MDFKSLIEIQVITTKHDSKMIKYSFKTIGYHFTDILIVKILEIFWMNWVRLSLD